MKPSPLLTCLTFLSLAVGVVAQDFRQWDPPDGTPIRQGYHIEWFRGVESRLEGENAGEVAMVWSDCRWNESKFGDRGIYIQVIGTNNEFKFQSEGMQVADARNRQEDPGVWPCADGGWFVAWEDFDQDTSGDIYCTKINADGERLWATDNPYGVPVCVYSAIQEDVRIVEDGDGGCIIAWRDWRNGDTGDIYAMHILSDGVPDPDWTANGIPIIVSPGPQTNHTADTDGSGGMIIGWKDGREIGNYDIWIQRINPDGELLWGDGEGIRVCGNNADQDSPKLCPDGSGGTFISWVDDRNSEDTGKDIYAQRLNENGEILWDPDGEPLCTALREQSGNRIVNTWPGEAVVAWQDKRTDGNTYDIYAMRISGSNHISQLWNPATGLPIAVADNDQAEVRIDNAPEGGCYFVWEDQRNHGAPSREIYTHQFNRQGQPVWAENGIPVCATREQNNSAVVRQTADGGCAAIWGKGDTGVLGVFAQTLDSHGEALLDSNGVPVCAGIAGNALYPKLVRRNADSFITIWLDGRFSDQGSVPFVQYIRNSGDEPVFILPFGGVPALTGTIGGGDNCDAAPDGADGAIVVWEDHRRGPFYSIYAQRTSDTGQRLWGDSGLKMANGSYEQLTSFVVSDGNGGAIIAWKSDTDEQFTNLYMQRVDADGNTLWGDEGIRFTNHSMDDYIEAMISDDQYGAVLIYKANNDDLDIEDDLFAIRVNSDGENLWGEEGTGLVLCNEINKQRNVRLVRHQGGFVVVWVDDRNADEANPYHDIYLQLITPDGEIRLEPNGSEISGYLDASEDYPDVTVDNDAWIWVVWEDFRWSGARGRDIVLQCTRPGLWFDPVRQDTTIVKRFRLPAERFGKVIISDSTDQLRPRIVHDGYNGVWLAWEDMRTRFWADLYAIHLKPNAEPYPGWERQSGNAVTSAFHRQQEPQLMPFENNGREGVAVVWTDKRSTGKAELFNLYTQRLLDPVYDEGTDTPEPVTPTGFTLDPVYPNPFNSRAMVSFTAQREGDITLALYDLAGRLVVDLAGGWWSAGRHRAVIDGSGLPSGSYLIRLTAGSVKLEQPIQLIK